MDVSKHLRIFGHVQGVGFRMYMRRKADDLGVTGWVRNRRDGSVEAVVQGPPQAVEALIAWTHRGPPGAIVTDLKIADQDADGFSDFSAWPTE